MTAVEISFRYAVPPGDDELRALSTLREVYGIRSLRFDEKNSSVTVEFDATRLTADNVESLLRNAGMDIAEKLSPIAGAAG
jgi:hypothetical protein